MNPLDGAYPAPRIDDPHSMRARFPAMVFEAHIPCRRRLSVSLLGVQAGALAVSWQVVRTTGSGALGTSVVASLTLGAMIMFIAGLATVWVVRRFEARVEIANRGLAEEVELRIAQSDRTRDAMILGLASLAESRDEDTGEHLERIGAYCRILASEARDLYPEIDEAWVERIGVASSLHDIGKVGVSDRVLLKPGPLDEAEREHMKHHTVIGARTLRSVQGTLGEDELVRMSIEIAEAHHEHWNGLGYPHGIKGVDIPLSARIAAIADVYDALTSARVYKPAMSHGRAVAVIASGRGTQFDPALVDAFLRVSGGFDDVRVGGSESPATIGTCLPNPQRCAA